VPQQAHANIPKLRKLYPGVYGTGGFFDAVNPKTGPVGHRSEDPVSWAAKLYLSYQTMSISGDAGNQEKNK
jgi:hypothetical protein